MQAAVQCLAIQQRYRLLMPFVMRFEKRILCEIDSGQTS